MLKIILEEVKIPEKIIINKEDVDLTLNIARNIVPDVYDLGLTESYTEAFFLYRKKLWDKISVNAEFMQYYNTATSAFKKNIDSIFTEKRPKFIKFWPLVLKSLSIPISQYLRSELDDIIIVSEAPRMKTDLPINFEVLPQSIGIILRIHDAWAFYNFRAEIRAKIEDKNSEFAWLNKRKLGDFINNKVYNFIDWKALFAKLLTYDNEILIKLKILLEEVKSKPKIVKEPGFFDNIRGWIQARWFGKQPTDLPNESQLLPSISNYEDNLYDLLKYLEALLQRRPVIQGNRTILSQLSKLIKHLDTKTFIIAQDTIRPQFELAELLIKISSATPIIHDRIVTNLIVSIRRGIKERIQTLDNAGFPNRFINLTVSFSADHDYEYKLNFINDPKLSLKHIRSINTQFQLKGGIINNISQYFRSDVDTYYINFREYYLSKSEMTVENTFDRLILSQSDNPKLNVKTYIAGRVVINGLITYTALNIDFIEKIKIKLNEANSRLVIMLYIDTLCDSKNYELLCDLIYIIPAEKITVLYDYKELVINGQKTSRENISCSKPHDALTCKEGVTFSNIEPYAKILLKIYSIVKYQFIYDNKEVENLLTYIDFITKFTDGINFFKNAGNGRNKFISIKGDFITNPQEKKDTADFINAEGNNIATPTHALKGWFTKGTRKGSFTNWRIIITIITDIIILYNRIAYISSNNLSPIKNGMQMNPIVTEIIHYIQAISSNFI